MDNIWKIALRLLGSLLYPPKKKYVNSEKDLSAKNTEHMLSQKEIVEHLHDRRCKEYDFGETAKVHFLGNYSFEPLKTLIWRAKFHNCGSSQAFIAELLSDEIISIMTDRPFVRIWRARPVVIHVPSTRFVLKTNPIIQKDHMASIRDEVKSMLQSFISENDQDDLLRISPHWIERESSMENKKLSRYGRIQGSILKFECIQEIPRNMPVILLDDIMTTGATIKDARRALETASATHIYSMVLAH